MSEGNAGAAMAFGEEHEGRRWSPPWLNLCMCAHVGVRVRQFHLLNVLVMTPGKSLSVTEHAVSIVRISSATHVNIWCQVHAAVRRDHGIRRVGRTTPGQRLSTARLPPIT